MKKKLKMLVISFTIMFGIVSSLSKPLFPNVDATYVEGPITRDTVWTLVDSPFVVSKNIIVYSNATLTIEPGVQVRFGGNFNLTVSGKLYANGGNKQITFTSNKMQPKAGDWNAIVFNGIQTSTLIGCSISYATDGISVQNGDVEIRNCTMSLSQNGISITGNGQVIIQENTVMANGNGILLTGNASNVNISRNKISANTQAGIRIDAENLSGITILNNIISSNNEGFHISTPISTQITDNSIFDNKIGMIYDEGNHEAHFNDIYGNEMGMDVISNAIASNVSVNAERNYWGDPSGPYHESLNPKGKGNRVGGDGVDLDFVFFLTNSFSYVNTRPTAILLTDKLLVPPNEDVIFFATNSFDSDINGRIDEYLFNFGDGSNSGWTTLSIFTHKYSSPSPPEGYSATLTVMDDYGTTSDNNDTKTITVQNLPSLQVTVDLNNSRVVEGDQVSVTVHVTNGTAAIGNANIALFSVKSRNFTAPSGLTDENGYFTTKFTAPNVTLLSNIRIVARASESGYADGSDYKYLEVLPKLSVIITANTNAAISYEAINLTVHVEYEGTPIAEVNVTLTAENGNFSITTGLTDNYGNITSVFTVPPVNNQSLIIITAHATKAAYPDGQGQLALTDSPGTLNIQISVPTVESGESASIAVNVTCIEDSTPVAGATVTISSDYGYFTTMIGTTNHTGTCTFNYSAPRTTTDLLVTITVNATKNGFIDAGSQRTIWVIPETTPSGGWSLITLLLILIPVIIAVIVVILIKLKIIVISSEEEESSGHA